MPNYPTHARWGRVGGALTGVAVGSGVYALLAAPVLAVVAAVGAAVTTFVGAIYPDVDHHDSIPRRKAVRGFRLLAVLGVVALASLARDRLLAVAGSVTAGTPIPPVAAAVAIAAVGAAVAALLVDPALGAVTREHRGWTHSAGINLLIVGTLLAGTWLATGGPGTPVGLVAASVVGCFYLGTLIHLLLDGEL